MDRLLSFPCKGHGFSLSLLGATVNSFRLLIGMPLPVIFAMSDDPNL